MRLQKKHIRQIRKIARDIFGNDVRVILFGSRTDDQARGGDIDLLIDSPKREKMNFENKIKFLTELKMAIGDQKIDVVYKKEKSQKDFNPKNQNVDIIATALKTGVEL